MEKEKERENQKKEGTWKGKEGKEGSEMGIKKNRRKGGEGEGKMKRKPEMRGETGKNEETIGKQIRDDIRADEKRTGGRSIDLYI